MAIYTVRAASQSSLASDYDTFLFASIGEDRNGMPLSVLSVLARLDVDPWLEAAQLAQLPEKTAAGRLLLRLEALPDPPSAGDDPGTLAARLVSLLPGGSDLDAPKRRIGKSWIVLYLVFIALVMGSEFLMASHPMPVATPSPPSDPKRTM